MARPLRFEIENGWHHVTARGNERQAIFRDDEDRRRFLELLASAKERFGLVVAAYVLMDNHYHLALCTPSANLSRALQWLGVRYTIGFNRRHRRVGHLFQGRFKSVLVDERQWLGELTRYVHLNPVRIRRHGLDKKQRQALEHGAVRESAAVVRARLMELRSYRWSSYRAYAGWEQAPDWLDTGRILNRLAGGKLREKQTVYRAWVEEAVRGGQSRSPWESVREGAVLGSARFLERIKTKLKALHGEKHRVRRVQQGVVDIGRVRRAIEQVKEERWTEFSGRHGDWGRDLFLWLGRQRSGLTLGELGELAGGMKASAASEAVRRMERRLSEDKSMKKVADKAEQILYVET